MPVLKWIINKREATVSLFLIGIFVLVGIVNPDFLSLTSINLISQNSILYIFLAAGMTFVLLTGNIDVSVGGILGFCGAIIATMVRDGANPILSVLLVLVIGALFGLINGIGVAIAGIPSIIMTLGTLGIMRGMIVIYTGGKWVENLPGYFKNPSSQMLFNALNIYMIITLLIIIPLQLYLSKSRRGRYFSAVGDNYNGAFLVGIPVKRITILAFIFSGLFAALAGCVYASQIGFIMNSTGVGIEMIAIASCVLGGVSLGGGIGSVAGASLGAVIMTTITSALVYLKVDASWNDAISGMLLITIVVSDVLIQRYTAEKAKKIRLSAHLEDMEMGQ